jgi:DNA helicase-2/ATP-dependent DNA helicase PcrA
MNFDTKVTEKLNDEQLAAVSHSGGNALVVAGPGSGKTRLIVERYYRKKEKRVLCLNFSNSATKEVWHRLRTKGVSKPEAYSFHGFAFKILNQYGITKAKIMDEGYNNALGIELGIDIEGIGKFHRGMLKKPPNLKNYEAYVNACEEKGVIDFSRLLYLLKTTLETNPEFSRKLAVYDEVMVDEFQDINKTQCDILLGLLKTKKSMNLFAVGDDDQCIYSWRGSRVDFMQNFQKIFGRHKVYHLNANYRSTPEIVEVAKSIISRNSNRISKNMVSQNDSGQKVAVIYCRDEVKFIAQKIKKIQENGDGSIAILLRTRSLITRVESELEKEKLSYLDREKFLSMKPVVILRSYLALLKEPSFKNLVALAKIQPLGLGAKTLEKLGDFPDIFQGLEALKKKKLVDQINYLKSLNKEEKIRVIIEESKLKSKYFKGQPQLLDSVKNFFLKREINDILEDNCIVETGVSIITMHESKGREFDHVFIPFVFEGIIPIKSSRNMSEECCLFYVGCTRAKKGLYLSYGTENYNAFGPSRYLINLPKKSILFQMYNSNDFSES